MAMEGAASPERESSMPRAYAGVALFMLALVLSLGYVFGRTENGAQRFVPDKWLHMDGTFYYLTLRTLVDHHSLAQDVTQPHSWYEMDLGWNRGLPADWSDVAVGRGGHWYPKHPILMPLVTVPFFYAFGAYGPLIFNILCLALLPVLGYRIALRIAPWGAALVAGALLASSAFLTAQSWGYSNDTFYAVLVLLAFERAFAERPIASGVWFSLAIFAKATNAALLPALALIFLLRKDVRGLVRFGIAMVPGILIFAGLNTWMYGAPWHTGYNHILIRENGRQAFHDHAQDFDWANWGRWIKERLFAPSGQTNAFNLWDRAAFWFLAIPGALIALVRAPKIALPLLVGVVVPFVLLAPFQFFRVEFLNAEVALSVPFIAALLVPWVRRPPPPEPVRPGKLRWDRLAPLVVIAVLGGASVVRAAVVRHGDYFERHLTDAKVFLGPVPCDYFNWQVQRWECSNFDRGTDELMTGRSLNGLPRFGNKPEHLISLTPHPLHQPRRIVFPEVPFGDSLELRYGFKDGQAPRGHMALRAVINGQPQELALGAPGELKTVSLSTSALKGQKGTVELDVASDAGADATIYFDGGPK